jgi:hypothetical protein
LVIFRQAQSTCIFFFGCWGVLIAEKTDMMALSLCDLLPNITYAILLVVQRHIAGSWIIYEVSNTTKPSSQAVCYIHNNEHGLSTHTSRL